VALALAQQPSEPIRASGYGVSNAFGTVVDAMTGSLTRRQPADTTRWFSGSSTTSLI
jgi:hypothetical protein